MWTCAPFWRRWIFAAQSDGPVYRVPSWNSAGSKPAFARYIFWFTQPFPWAFIRTVIVFVAVALDHVTSCTFVTCTEKYSLSIKGQAPSTTHVWRSSVNVFKCGSPNKAHNRKSCGFLLICSLDSLVCANVKFKQAGCFWAGVAGVFVVGRAVPFVGSETFPQLWSFICRGISVDIVWKCMSELQLFTAFFTSWTQRKNIANAVQIARFVAGSAASTALSYGAMHRSFNTCIHVCLSADTTSCCGNKQLDSSTWKTAVSPSLNRKLMSLLHDRLSCRT